MLSSNRHEIDLVEM